MHYFVGDALPPSARTFVIELNMLELRLCSRFLRKGYVGSLDAFLHFYIHYLVSIKSNPILIYGFVNF